MPEEINRVVTDRVSDVLLAPSADAVENLRREGHDVQRIVLAGNVMVDTLLANLDRARSRPVLRDLGLEPGAYGVITLHRPTNVDDPTVLAELLDVAGGLSAELPMVFPAHPRTLANLARRAPEGVRAAPAGVRVIDPVGYLDFVALEASARIVLTDSGGVQEETTVLGVPCLTLRDTTERPITVSQGTNLVVGRDPARIREAAREVLANGIEPRCPDLWDGRAGERIARALRDATADPNWPRPT
jgi:UDP-N-acetylglucosamine 2-epimerase (non-hydrolysing)